MARIKMAYIGGGSTRGAGTMASFIHHRGADFDGSTAHCSSKEADGKASTGRSASRLTA